MNLLRTVEIEGIDETVATHL